MSKGRRRMSEEVRAKVIESLRAGQMSIKQISDELKIPRPTVYSIGAELKTQERLQAEINRLSPSQALQREIDRTEDQIRELREQIKHLAKLEAENEKRREVLKTLLEIEGRQ
jgi:sugar-specific transcriptional regulator TrmB